MHVSAHYAARSPAFLICGKLSTMHILALGQASWMEQIHLEGAFLFGLCLSMVCFDYT